MVHATGLLLLQLTQRRAGSDQAVRVIEVFNVVRPPVARPVSPSAPSTSTTRLAARPLVRRPPLLEPPLDSPPLPITVLAPAADPLAPAAPPSARAPHDSGLMHSARQLARKDDYESRKGKPAPLGAPATPFAKMQAAMAGAHSGGPLTMSSYTAPDGVVVTRMQRGGRSTCYMSSGVNGMPSAVNRSGYIGAVGGARETNCPPPGEGWRKQ